MTRTDAPPGLVPGAGVEVATWRPLEVVDVDGWRVGRSGGFTRRANSVLPVSAPSDVPAALDRVEALYAPGRAVFRVDADAQPPHLDALLEARGYARVAPTRVMVLDQPRAPGDRPRFPRGMRVQVADEPDEPWLTGWLGVKAGGGDVDAGRARALVVGTPATYLTARDDDGVAGVLRAAYAGGWVALSSLMVAPRARRRGLATALTAAALQTAADRGVGRAFLQVEEGNAAAVALYARCGFALAYGYHYRER